MRSGSTLCGHLLAEAGWIRYAGETHCSLDDEDGFEEAFAKVREFCDENRHSHSEEAPLCDKAVAPWTLPEQGRSMVERVDQIYLLLRHPLAIWRSQKETGWDACTLEKLANQLTTMRCLVERTPAEKLRVLSYYDLTSEEGREALFGRPLNSFRTNAHTGEPGWGDPNSLIRTGKIKSLTIEEDLERAVPEVWMDLEDEHFMKAMVEFRKILKLTGLQSLDVLVPELTMEGFQSLSIVEGEVLAVELVQSLLGKGCLPLSIEDFRKRNPLPLRRQVFREIESQDLVHRFVPHQLLPRLKELLGLLRKGGVLRLMTIDSNWVCQLAGEMTSEEEQWYLAEIGELGQQGTVTSAAFITDYLLHARGHRFLYDRSSLIALLSKAGFCEVREIAVKKGESSDGMPVGLLARERFLLEAVKGEEL